MVASLGALHRRIVVLSAAVRLPKPFVLEVSWPRPQTVSDVMEVFDEGLVLVVETPRAEEAEEWEQKALAVDEHQASHLESTRLVTKVRLGWSAFRATPRRCMAVEHALVCTNMRYLKLWKTLRRT